MKKNTILLTLYKSISFRLIVTTLLVTCQVCIFSQSFSQKAPYPKEYFRSPIDFPIRAAAYFGDVRANHFHSGLDIRTQGVEGKNVYAVADGYISRIRVSAGGFGYALYINHPNGFTTLYGHLQRYNDAITAYILKRHYEKELFEIDVFPDSNTLPVKKGDIIALSGNSGGSEGPHLHFEVRDTKTEQIINPQLCGFEIPDHISPLIKKLVLYRYQRNGIWKELKEFPVLGKDGKYYIVDAMPLKYNGDLGIGVEASDDDDVSGMTNGFYSAEVMADGKRIFHQEMERFSFSETRYVNSSIDYEKKLKTKQTIQRLFLLPNNKMSIFKPGGNRGIIHVSGDTPHTIEISIKDKSGNSSSLRLFITGDPDSPSEPKEEESFHKAVFVPGKLNSYSTDNFKIEIPEGVLYDTLLFEYFSTPSTKKYFSDLHLVHNIYTPVHSNYTLSIRTNVPEALRSKAFIVSVNSNNMANAEGGTYENGFITAQVRTFGNFAVLIDTTAPRAIPLNISPNANLKGAENIKFRISDNLSGIKSYRGTIDGKWILMALDGKTSTLTYSFDKPLTPGKHRIKLMLTDKVDNVGSWEAEFNY